MIQLLQPPLPDGGDKSIGWTGLFGAGLGLAVAEAAAYHDGILLTILESERQLQILETEIRFFLERRTKPGGDEIPVSIFPHWECLPYDNFSPHQDIVSDRLRILARLPERRRGVVLTTCANLMQRLPPTDYVIGHSFSLGVGDRIDLNALRGQLQQTAYHAVNQVMSPGEFAVRGGLVDIFPMGADQPFRLDLFDDAIETIRYFDPESQRSTGTTEAIELLPAREYPLTEAGIRQFRQSFRRRFEGDPAKQQIYSAVSQGHTPPGTEFFMPLFFEHTATLFDYLPDNSLLILDRNYDHTAGSYWAEVQDRFHNASFDPGRRVLPPADLYLDSKQLQSRVEALPRILKSGAETLVDDWRAASAPPPELPVDGQSETPYRRLLQHLQTSGSRILLAAETEGRREALEGLLQDCNLLPEKVHSWHEFADNEGLPLAICVTPLERGLRLTSPALEIITENQLYGKQVFQRRRRSRESLDPESVIRSLAELNVGDPVVHVEHGVGRYLGLQNLSIGDDQTEFLTLEYRDGDKLYVPILSLQLVGRFVGGDPEHAPLHKLGSEQWQRAKRRALEKAYDVAAELLEMEALRNARSGNSFALPAEEYALFSARFPFEETADQEQAIADVLADLQSSDPMDRLVCGDVGFGKTEVALRAAFVAVQNGKQVALLAPTTLLAQQHYQTFCDRFADMAVSIEQLSRFRSKKEAAELVQRLGDGYPDIVIGTHRLLQADIRFKRLGLVIIDEEHRFGVRQKEKLKQLRSQVDILTLTATPIPRTLNMTMSGLRSISIIATPPQSRLSIKTFVRGWNRGLIREACLREIRRGGQVYFLHNQVRTIHRTAEELAKLVPEAKVEIGHGQMRELELERVMRDFYHQRFNILVCTTIIESGIDVPSANTMVIDRAERFGLAQLHQLRGRVGRSHHQAYAYLLTPDRETLTSDARKRLDAIAAMEDLGAGFTLASHDLEIRGAGELLGETQSGLIDNVGFTLYAEYLNRAVKAIRENRTPEAATMEPEKNVAKVELHLPALFPEDYLPDVHSRLVLYKRIANASDDRELDELQVEVVDRFGLLPPQGKNLFRLTSLRLLAERLGIRKLEIGDNGGSVVFEALPAVDPTTVLLLLNTAPKVYRLAGPHTLRIRKTLTDGDERIAFVRELLEKLATGI